MDRKTLYHIVEWSVALAACAFLLYKIVTYDNYAALGEALRNMSWQQWTAMGLCVAIMALAVHAYFTQRLENIITDMEQCFSLVEANRKVLAGKAGKVSGAGEAV